MNNSEKQYIELGNFLKTRRNNIPPLHVGLPNGNRRRTPGLRREEVAQLASISLTWYTWLEQGRPINVSDQVLESICKVLLLTADESNYLFTLAGKSYSDKNCSERSYKFDALKNVLDNLDIVPAYIMDAKWNVIAWNESASKVFCDFNKIEPSERNIVWMMFHNKDYMALFNDWAYHASGILARFRATYGKQIHDDWFTSFLSRLNQSPLFNELWSLHDVHAMSNVRKEITHPIVGNLSFEFNSFDVSDNTDLKLIIHTPLADTKEKVTLLMKNEVPAMPGRTISTMQKITD